MYTVFEHKKVSKALVKAPLFIQRNYIVWKRIVELQGVEGLRLVKGFHDEVLRGTLKGFRSSRLSRKWRVIYKVNQKNVEVYVCDINANKY